MNISNFSFEKEEIGSVREFRRWKNHSHFNGRRNEIGRAMICSGWTSIFRINFKVMHFLEFQFRGAYFISS